MNTQIQEFATPEAHPLDELLQLFKSLGDPTRLRLVRLLFEGELSVNEITRVLKQSQPRISRHLKLLCEAGVLEKFREQHHSYYRVPKDGIGQDIARMVCDRILLDDPEIHNDRRRLTKVIADREKLSADFISEDAPEWAHLHTLHGDEEAFEAAIIDLLANEPLGELLDVATGTGRMLCILGQLCEHGVGVDSSRKMTSVARTNLQRRGLGHCTIRQADMYSLQFDDGVFNTVCLDQVLYFAERPEEVIQEAVRVLQPGGRLLIVAFTAARSSDDIELGIRPDTINEWCSAAGVEICRQRALPGDLADIVLILANKPIS